MDAKSKANFINSVARGESVPCPNCGASNMPGTNFCISCGTPFAKGDAQPAQPVQSDTTPFAPAAEAPKTAQAPLAPTASQPAVQPVYEEPASVFADGLPAWDIVPPQVVIRRRHS